jgi:hypothetical protein
MQTAWSILALALFATDGAPPDKPRPPGPRFTVTFRITDPFVAASPKTSAETPEPDRCSRPVEERVECRELWQLSLPQAIHVALDNCDFILVESETKALATHSLPLAGGLHAENLPIVITRLKADDDDALFKAEAMALVRSVEQQYWNLFVAQVHLENALRAVSIAEEVISKELAELACCREGCLELADAADRLDQLDNDLARGASSVAENEQRLRLIMGLPSADDRRIVPCTDPVNQWIAIGAKSVLKKENRARRKGKQRFESRAGVDDSAHSLAQLLLGVSDDFRSYQKARKSANAAAKQLEIQMRSYQKGRITADRLLVFVRQHAASVAAEARCLAAYNITLAALAEMSGTLLTYRDILVAEEPETLHLAAEKKDDKARLTAFESDQATGNPVPQIEVIPELAKPATDPPSTEPAQVNAKLVRFSISLGGFKCELSVGKDTHPASEAKHGESAGH